MTAIELTGYAAGVIVAVSLLPQIIKSWQTKSTKDISFVWNSIYILGVSLWVSYGIFTNDIPIIATMSIELLMAVILISLKLRFEVFAHHFKPKKALK
ncbi:MAG: SemiSWEET transporter [Candidatus Diapherotrites archaeon]|nr:SemiSWEET transporter [Candidatus Diapherotrites archaeon]